MTEPDRHERCVIVLNHGHRHLLGLRHKAWYSAQVIESPTLGAWTLDYTPPRWVAIWPDWLAAWRLQPELDRLLRALAAAGWRSESDAPLHLWRSASAAMAGAATRTPPRPPA